MATGRGTRAGATWPVPRPVVAVAGLVLAVLAVAVAGGSTAWPSDAAVAAAVAAWAPPYETLLVIDYVGEPVGAIVLVSALAAVCVLVRRPRFALVALVSLALSGLGVTGLKAVVGRTIHGPENLAFPSGHTATATVLALTLLLLVVDLARPRSRTSLPIVAGGTLLAAAVMSVDQVLLTAHYFTDTVGGLCLAVVVVGCTARVVDLLSPPRLRHLTGRATSDARSFPP